VCRRIITPGERVVVGAVTAEASGVRASSTGVARRHRLTISVVTAAANRSTARHATTRNNRPRDPIADLGLGRCFGAGSAEVGAVDATATGAGRWVGGLAAAGLGTEVPPRAATGGGPTLARVGGTSGRRLFGSGDMSFSISAGAGSATRGKLSGRLGLRYLLLLPDVGSSFEDRCL